jgi:4-hydroxyphenylpyruvate dioxygenase
LIGQTVRSRLCSRFTAAHILLFAVGLLLDTFHVAGYTYASPCHPSGVRIGGSTRLALSLNEFSSTVPASKIFYVQLADAELIDPPLSELGEEKGKSPFEVEGQQPRMSWSRNCRLFLGEQDRGGYLPAEKVLKAILETGYEGYARCAQFFLSLPFPFRVLLTVVFHSFEIFHRDLFDKDKSTPTLFAERAKKSWQRLEKQFDL